MPEGDTVRISAMALREYVLGKPVVRVLGRGLVKWPDFVGRRITTIQTHGKNLLLGWDDGRVVRVHLGMSGGWLKGVANLPKALLPNDTSLVLNYTDTTLICCHASTVEFLNGFTKANLTTSLGPDLLARPVPWQEVFRRLVIAANLNPAVGELLLNQQVAAGIGNVYKSELLFIERIHPLKKVKRLEPERVMDLFRLASDLLKQNIGPQNRVTTRVKRPYLPVVEKGENTWVYERATLPCLVCTTRIVVEKQGLGARVTYFCPKCQPL